ncbi:MAG: hypothetical protein ACXVY3_07805 [Gaiellaceae bacterium]
MAFAPSIHGGLDRERQRYQNEIETLLEQIHMGSVELQRLKAGGVLRAGLSEQKRRLARARARLAALTGPEDGRRAA